MDWKKHIKASEQDIKIVESVNVDIEAIEVHGLYLIVYKDPFLNVFKKQYIESNRYILKEQIPFEMMQHYRKTAELVLKNNYS